MNCKLSVKHFFFRKPRISRHLSDECLIKLCHLHQLLSNIHQKSADPKIPWMLTSTSGALFPFEPPPPARVSFTLSEIITAPKHHAEGHRNLSVFEVSGGLSAFGTSTRSSAVALRGPEGGHLYKEAGGEVFASQSIKAEGYAICGILYIKN